MARFRNNKMPKEVEPVYQSFLVRCWLIPAATSGEAPTWRYELRDVSAEPQKHGFSDLEQLKEHMSAKLEAIAAGSYEDSEEEEGWKGGDL